LIDWVNPRADLDEVAKRKKSLLLPGIEPRLTYGVDC
jgi:hypothetical protein